MCIYIQIASVKVYVYAFLHAASLLASAGNPVLPCGTFGRGWALGVPAMADGGLVDRAVAVLQDTVKVKDVKGHAAVSVLCGLGFARTHRAHKRKTAVGPKLCPTPILTKDVVTKEEGTHDMRHLLKENYSLLMAMLSEFPEHTPSCAVLKDAFFKFNEDCHGHFASGTA